MSNGADQQFSDDRLTYPLGKDDLSEDQVDALPFSEELNLRLHNFPVSLTTLLGREQACETANAMLQRPEVRLLTLTGTCGVGKTRLALAIASNFAAGFPDGVYFVPLSAIRNPDLVVPTIAQVLGLKEPGNVTFLASLKNFLSNKCMVLLLDNFEQVITASPLLSELLVACPEVKLLLTSREVLRIQGEYEFVVPPLPLPDLIHLPPIADLAQWPVIALFMQRAQAVKPNFHMTEANAHDIAAICVRLDGLPLAVELAAARIKLLPPQALLLRLEHRLQILTSGRSDMPARHQTLRDTIAWSYGLLDDQEQRLFRHLSVFTGGCSLVAIEAICVALGDITIPVLDGVSSLVDKSLVAQLERGDDEPRLSLLETVREYGVERMVAHQELACMCHAHARYYLELAEEADQASYGADAALWLDRQELENDNFRAALRWSLEQKEATLALKLAAALSHFWFL
ncbi:MAG TPA: NB-ARC domain-containing protein, partial [Ktedonobacteraceae bacterium]|nr:NB-ARC domain-containing protein [Ktedonobacteraceae bacterium]